MFSLNTFYKSKEWEDLVEIIKLERNMICEHCGGTIVKAYDCIAHHKIELTEANVNDYNISLNPDNIMLVHHRCHNIIHDRWQGNTSRRVYIVYGSPCSGKSTFVIENAGKNDIVLDIDKIWECISTNTREYKSNYLKANVFGVRDCILDMIRTRTGMWRNAYIIGGYPLKMERQRLADKLGAELIYIECEKNICIDRCINDEWKKFVNEWWELYQP